MTEPELEGMGVSSASRRRFMWLGGGMVASLLLLPEFSFAAKVSNAVKKASTGSSAKAATPAKQSGKAATQARSSANRSTAAAKSSSGKSTAKSGSSSTRSSRSASSARSSGKGSDKLASRKSEATSKGRDGVASRHDNPHGRVVTTARADEVERESELALPEDFAPTRPFSFGDDAPESRDLSFYCVHTGEQLNIDYFVGGRYEPDALEAIDHLLRDYHNDEICQIDPRVLNQLFDLRRALGSSEAFHVFSGYRSPATNESYRRISGRVAEHSYHMTGQAIDIQLPGRDIRQLRNIAVAMRAGGVGYYPSEGFLHLDSGPIRRW
jgi:uncharacterized protein YcbK (DUF882 family)